MKLTKGQRAALREAAGPRKFIRGTGLSWGAGRMLASPRVENALEELGLVEVQHFGHRIAILTRAGWEEAARLEEAKKR